jgi:hypothetical protein
VGRLDEIIDRNKHPGKHRKMQFPLGLILAAFVLLVLILIIFTDLAFSPMPTSEPEPAAEPDTGQKRVNGVLLYRDRPRTTRDGGIDAR